MANPLVQREAMKQRAADQALWVINGVSVRFLPDRKFALPYSYTAPIYLYTDTQKTRAR